jgi:hypothetical protein
VGPEEITRMLREKSDENVTDGGESGERETVNRCDHDSE